MMASGVPGFLKAQTCRGWEWVCTIAQCMVGARGTGPSGPGGFDDTGGGGGHGMSPGAVLVQQQAQQQAQNQQMQAQQQQVQQVQQQV